MTIEEKYNQIIAFIKQYTEETNAKGYVLGISGGKDSTVVAKLLVDAVGADNVVGVMMPNGVQRDIDDSQRVCFTLNIDWKFVNIGDSYQYLKKSICQRTPGEVNTEKQVFPLTGKALSNVPPKLRMTTLYVLAQSLGYRVAGTGNKSEAFVGWCTKWGDMACDINPIAHLTCTEVVELGDYLGLPEELVHKHPADGLTGKSDEDNFGFTYAELDEFIAKYEAGPISLENLTEVEQKILDMHKSAYHKDHVITINNYGKW